MKWKIDQINLGVNFLSEKNCNPEYVMADTPYNASKPRNWGFPKDILFSYGYLNQDKKIDALITFRPNQCDGGNLSMWTEIQLLVLSSNSGYNVNENFFDTCYLHKKGYFFLNKIENCVFVGDYYEFKETDSHCCPSIHKSIYIDFKTKKTRLR
jgi:hypothetical protein